MKTNEIRDMFLKFFKYKHHDIKKSSSLIPQQDNTLLFTNAGMNQFKNIFLGIQTSKSKNIATTQYCIRTGGKHNDLQNIGFSKYHHTLFEMLGNFSFGGYFKKKAIFLAWEFLTSKKWLNLNKKKIWITYYQKDYETFKIWSQIIKIEPKKLIAISDNNNIPYNSDNFWKMGDIGPCGPCSEIFYNYENKEDNCQDFFFKKKKYLIEIWNLVFMEFNLTQDGQLLKLPIPCIDTGMGLERVASILQNVNSSYKIDNFNNLIKSIANYLKLTDIKHPSLFVICDHLRTTICLISENIFPGNEGRNYILRKIIRRALSHGYFLGIKTLFFYKLPKYVYKHMKDLSIHFKFYKKMDIIRKIIKKEEKQFHEILIKGINKLNQEFKILKNNILCEKKIFYLYDTFGLPIEITEDLCKQKKIIFNKELLNKIKEKNKNKSKSLDIQKKKINLNLKLIEKKTIFLGYKENKIKSKIIQIIIHEKNFNTIKNGEYGIIVLDLTPFYSESGGQIGDTGIIFKENSIFYVQNTQKYGEYIGHIGYLSDGYLSIQDNVVSEINFKKRENIQSNHTATHLLHAALQNIYKQKILQKGSLITDKILRFDFICNKKIRNKEIINIEKLVNKKIFQNIKVKSIITTKEKFNKYNVMKLNNKNYPNKIRIIKINNFSEELCIGTHHDNTGKIGCFKIININKIGHETIRITAITGMAVIKYSNEITQNNIKIMKILNTDEYGINEKIKNLIHEIKIISKEKKNLTHQNIIYYSKECISKALKINKFFLIIEEIHNKSHVFLKTTSDLIKKKINFSVIILFSNNEKNIIFHINIHKNVMHYFNALDIMNDIFSYAPGKGGGKKDNTAGTLKQKNNISEIIKNIKHKIITKIQ